MFGDWWYVIGIVREDDIPILLQISRIIQHDGTWIVCGSVNMVQEHNKLLDSCIVEACTYTTRVKMKLKALDLLLLPE